MLCSCSPLLMNLISLHYPSLHSVSLIQNNTPLPYFPLSGGKQRRLPCFPSLGLNAVGQSHCCLLHFYFESFTLKHLHPGLSPIQSLNSLSKLLIMDPFIQNALQPKVMFTPALIKMKTTLNKWNILLWEVLYFLKITQQTSELKTQN